MQVFTGLPVSPGYGEGRAILYRGLDTLFAAARETPGGELATEEARFADAVAAARRELRALSRNIERDYGRAEGRILHAQAFMLEDPLFQATVREQLTSRRASAEAAVVGAVEELEARFQQNSDSFIRDRVLDIHDIGARVLHRLADRTHHPLARLPGDVVLIAEQLLPSDTVFLDRSRVRAIVTEQGGESSHAAILARALGIPAVAQVHGILEACRVGDSVAVDGELGRVIRQIEGATRDEYARQAHAYRIATDSLRGEPCAEAATRDGTRITLLANVASPEDTEAAVRCGAAGVGLFRTEFFYLFQRDGTAERAQAAVYRSMAERMRDRPVNVRTVDLAPDKLLPLADDLPFARAAIRDRGIHHSLKHPELLRPQLRAILRANDLGNLRILLPGVTDVREIGAVRSLVDELRTELGSQGTKPGRLPPIGAMIETPPALLMAPEIMRAADFVCIGTNDLLHYLFGRERQAEPADDETMFEPSLLRAVAMVVRTGKEASKEVSLCGEIAGAPPFTALLIGLGLRHLSMSPARLSKVRYNVRQTDCAEATQLAQEALALTSAEEVRALISKRASPWQRLVEGKADES